MTPAADMTVDYPHGTTAGYNRGCHGSGECPGAYGQTCAQAKRRASSDWQYAKAVGKDREVEYLAREHEAAAAPAKSAKVKRAEAQQRKSVRETPPAFQPDPDDHLEGWDRPREDGPPFHAPEPPLPTEPTVPAGFERFDRQAATSQARATAGARGHTRRTHESRSASAQKSTEAQRQRALATASAEHPLGLKLDGTPRVRPAKGTVLTELGLRSTGDYPTTETDEERAEAVAAYTPAPPVLPTPSPQPAAAAPAPAPAVPGATLEDMADAAQAADRVAAVLADTNWRDVARNLNRIADAMEKLRGLA